MILTIFYIPSLGYGKDYKYNPDYEYQVKQDYLPDILKGNKFWEYSDNRNNSNGSDDPTIDSSDNDNPSNDGNPIDDTNSNTSTNDKIE